MEREHGERHEPLAHTPQPGKPCGENLLPGAVKSQRPDVELPSPAAPVKRSFDPISDAPWEVDLKNDENLVTFLEAHISTDTVSSTLDRAMRPVGEVPQVGDVYFKGAGCIYLVAEAPTTTVAGHRKDAELFGWNPSGRSIPIDMAPDRLPYRLEGEVVIARHQLMESLENVVRTWKEASPDERLEHAFEEILPEGGWVNWGDMNFVPHGGLQVKREGNQIHLLYLTSAEEPKEGETFFLERGTVMSGDLFVREQEGGRARFTENVLSAMKSGGTTPSSPYLVDLEDSELKASVESFLLDAPCYGGFLDRDRTWSPANLLQSYALAHPLGEVDDLDQAVPVRNLKVSEALDRTRLQDWVDANVRNDLAFIGLQGMEEDVIYPNKLETPHSMLCPYESDDDGFVLDCGLDLLREGRKAWYAHGVTVKAGSPAESFLVENQYSRSHGFQLEGVQNWVYVKHLGLEQAIEKYREPEQLIAEGMDEFHNIVSDAATAWINDERLNLSPENAATVAQLVDGILERHNGRGFTPSSQDREDLIRQMIVERWACLATKDLFSDVLFSKGHEQDREETAGVLNKAMDHVWAVKSAWDKYGVVDRYTFVLADQSYLGLSDNPDSPAGFSQWGEGAVVGENLGRQVLFHQIPKNVVAHAIKRLKGEAFEEDPSLLGPTAAAIQQTPPPPFTREVDAPKVEISLIGQAIPQCGKPTVPGMYFMGWSESDPAPHVEVFEMQNGVLSNRRGMPVSEYSDTAAWWGPLEFARGANALKVRQSVEPASAAGMQDLRGAVEEMWAQVAENPSFAQDDRLRAAAIDMRLKFAMVSGTPEDISYWRMRQVVGLDLSGELGRTAAKWVERLETSDVEPDLFDDLLHDLYAPEDASEINNGGVSRQVSALIRALGLKEAHDRIEQTVQENGFPEFGLPYN